MTARWWDEPPRPSRQQGRRRPAPDFGRPPPGPSFPRWSISAVAYGIQFVTSAVLLFVVGVVGLLSAPVLGLAGADISEGSVKASVILVIVVIDLVSLAFQVRYVAQQGAERAVLACLTAAVTTQVVGTLAGFAGLPSLALSVGGAVLGITVVALMIRPAQVRAR